MAVVFPKRRQRFRQAPGRWLGAAEERACRDRGDRAHGVAGMRPPLSLRLAAGYDGPAKAGPMHILLLILSVAAGAAFWFYRLKMIGGAAKGALSAAHSAKGYVTRRRRAGQSDFAVITAIDAPPTAAATWLRLRTDLIGWEERRAEIAAFLTDAAGLEAAEEALVYAEWAASQDIDRRRAIRTLREALEGWLTQEELSGLDALAGTASQAP